MIILWALAAANILGVGWLAWRMVSINQEVDEQTQTRTFDCRDCGGLGVLWAPESGEAIRNTCLTCGGRGTITLPAVTESHETEAARQEPSPYRQPTPDPFEEGNQNPSRRYICPQCEHRGRVPVAKRQSLILCGNCGATFVAKPTPDPSEEGNQTRNN